MKNRFQNTINGHFVTLKKVAIEDAREIYNWRMGESGKYLRHPDNYSVESQIDWIKSRDNNEINYIISSKENDKKVGTIAIYDLNANDKVANVGRLLLSEEYLHKSTPYGLESLLLTYKYVFNEMDFFKITGDILGPNDDITHFEYSKKHNRNSGPAVVGLELEKPSDIDELIKKIKTKKFYGEYLNNKPDLFQILV